MIRDEHAEIKEETKKKMATPKRNLGTVALIETAIGKLDEKIV